MYKKILALTFITALAVPGISDETRAVDMNPTPTQSNSETDYWYFAGCVRSDFDCSWRAQWWGYRNYRVEWDIRCNSAPYACYVSDEMR